MQDEDKLHRVGVVDITDCEVDTLIDPIHASPPVSRQAVLSLCLDSMQGACQRLRTARLPSELLERQWVEAVRVADCQRPCRTERKDYSAYVETAFRKTFST